MDPPFGDVIQSPQTAKEKEKVNKERNVKKTKSSPVKDVLIAFHKPCLFCQKNHALSVCNQIKELTNTERIDFLKSKGLCFGCLTFGHLSKCCKKRLKCQVCSQSYPDILHVKTESNSDSERVEENNNGNNVVTSAYVSCGRESSGNTGAGEEDGCGTS